MKGNQRRRVALPRCAHVALSALRVHGTRRAGNCRRAGKRDRVVYALPARVGVQFDTVEPLHLACADEQVVNRSDEDGNQCRHIETGWRVVAELEQRQAERFATLLQYRLKRPARSKLPRQDGQRFWTRPQRGRANDEK